MSQALTLPVAGLMTDPGPFTAAPDGGLIEAQNVVVLRPGVIEPRPGLQFIADASMKALGGDAPACSVDSDGPAFTWNDASGTWQIRQDLTADIAGPTDYADGFIRIQPTGGRVLFTSRNGVATLPAQMASPAQGSATIAYRAGMPQPYAPRMETSTAGTAWLPNGESVAYRVTLVRRLADGTVVESAPSGRVVVTNSAGVARGVVLTDVLGGAYYAWAPNGVGALGYNDLLTGDELRVYRSARLAGTPSDEMRLRATLTWDATYFGFVNVINGTATPWYDGLDDSEWTGPALYTNETQEGAAYANFRPEYARDIALYNGMTFYAGARSPERVDITLTGLGNPAAPPGDPQSMLMTFGFTGDTLIGTNTILNVTNDTYFAVGQVITLLAQAPGAASATWPANTYVTAINTVTNIVTVSANALATGAGVSQVAWDWIESSLGGSRIYYNASGALGTMPARYFTRSAASLDNRWNGDNATTLQLRVTAVDQVESLTLSFFQPLTSDASFSIRSSKPAAWDRKVDSTTGVASEPVGGIAELQWSKSNEPEHVPLPNRTAVGDKAYAIRRIVSARNSLLIFKDDGLYQCFGQTPDSLTFEMLDRTVLLPPSKDAFSDTQSKWCEAFDDRVFAMTTRGPMVVSDTGAQDVGGPILESLRRLFTYAYGAGDEIARAMMVDTTARRVGFFIEAVDASGNPLGYSIGYILDVGTGIWTYWVFPRVVAACASLSGLGTPVFAGRYIVSLTHSDRTMLDDATVDIESMPPSYDSWFDSPCMIVSVTGTGPYTVTISAGSEWTPAVGDLCIRSSVAHEVTGVSSATVFETSTAPSVGANASWREAFAIRCIWLARAEGNVASEKHWMSLALTFELSTMVNTMQSYFAGYRNQAVITANAFEETSNGSTPWAIVPLYKRVAVPSAIARDWAIKVGFTINRAGAWFSTAGLSVLYTQAAPDKVTR